METIHNVIEKYFASWNEAFDSKNSNVIREHMSERFVGYWGRSGMDEPMQYGYNYDLDNVLAQYDDAHKSFEILSHIERKPGEEFLVIGTETNVIQGIPHHAKAMFIWRKENEEWKLQREFIELEK
ncbi:DUF4440 domain-containing protein [Alkalihalobacillus sp. TS-13]|uniref:DUF4440 domain-containing protein n=1 Tax=Alkalihalobacillus sp. TS-13 TaxID=2842455 RepID=UPI001C87EE8B|nr:DUF4440 domain-containing protein [Alkalihalobacillus sp. TS-13]